jgi:hypothetical protein
MLNYSDLCLNLFVRDGKCWLSAYGFYEFDQLDTSNFITVEIAESDYRIFTSDDDTWIDLLDSQFKNLAELFVLYLLNEKANKNV